MKIHTKPYLKYLPALLLSVAVLFSNIEAGQLSDELTQQIANKQPTELVKVWIKLPEVENAASLKAVALSAASTRKERYALTIERLRVNHIAAQADLMAHLNTLHSVNKQSLSKAPKSHWLVNIVEAELTIQQLRRLVNRMDIETIYPVPEIVTITPENLSQSPAVTANVEANLSYINVPAAWAAGYTGKGGVVCVFDTGVDGLHPALFSNWKGHDGDPSAAWFDPGWGTSFPQVLPVTAGVTYHGTATTGLTVGHDPLTGDTVGVALDAKWIAAAVADIEGASIIDAFEWAANPDGDPNSMDDVPDVINHSWGLRYIGCQDVFYTMIDNVEALDIVNIFAAGNEGTQGSSTIRNPANRANDSLDCFAIGNIDYRTGIIAPTSSRGPSDCNGAIKPNVVAPGVSVRTCGLTGSYITVSGTSFSTPQVSGLVALLRQKNPNATADEIKNAILTSTNRLNRALPNNDYGWGLIDCMAALNALPASNSVPNVRVFAFDREPIHPGDTIEGSLVLKNLGADVRNITALAMNTNPSLKVLSGLAVFGDISQGDTVRSTNPITVVVSDTVTEGSILSLDIQISNGTGYTVTRKLYYLVEQRSVRSMLTHDAGNIEFTLTNFGTFGLGDGSYFDAGGAGFRYLGGANYLYDGGLMIGRDADHVSDGVTNVATEPDGDFAVVSSGDIFFVPPLGPASQQSYSRFNDSRAENPMGIEVTQVSYAFDSAPYHDAVIIQFMVRNVTGVAINNVYVGLHLDWDVVSPGSNAGGYDIGTGSLWTAYNSSGDLSQYRGVAMLQGALTTAYTGLAEAVLYPPSGGGADGYTELEKMFSLARGIDSPSSYATGAEDLFQVMASRISLPAGAVDTIAFAFAAGQSSAEFFAGITSAQAAYDLILNTDVPPEIIPIENMTVLAGTDLSIAVSATDPNGTIPTLRAENLPAGATFSDNGGGYGLFEWAIGPTQTGSFAPVFIAEDGVNADTETVVITVLEGGQIAPVVLVVAVPDMTVLHGERIEFPVLGTDLNGTIPVLAVDSLPNGASFTDNGDGTGQFVWLTGFAELGDYTFMFTADDGALADTAMMMIRIIEGLPVAYALGQNYPNPFNSGTTIPFSLQNAVRYTLTVYNLLGGKVRQYTGQDGPGEVEIQFSSGGLASGVYFYLLEAGGFVESKKMLLIK